jgi:hypothetical protein
MRFNFVAPRCTLLNANIQAEHIFAFLYHWNPHIIPGQPRPLKVFSVLRNQTKEDHTFVLNGFTNTGAFLNILQARKKMRF